jgi:hypothetical protein
MASRGVICGVQWSSPKFELCVWENQMGLCTADTQFTTTTITPGSGYYDLVCENNAFTINGATETKTVTAANSTSYNLLIGAHGSGEIADYHGQMKLYYFKLYNNGKLVRNFIPCINTSGVAGFWDSVTGKFYGNSGTGEFAHGPLMIDIEDVTFVEYIESTGTQYIDTGISVPHASGKTVIEFAPMEISADNPIVGYTYPSWSWDTNLAFVSNSKILLANTYGPVVEKDVFYKLEYTTGYYKINDGSPVTLASGNYTDGYNNTISFASGKYGKNKIKSYKLYNNDILVRDLVPCIIPSGEAGMYDRVNGVFYNNAGTGSFTAGN